MIYLIIAVVIILLILFCRWQNNGIMVSEVEYTGANVPPQFEGYKILHVSDLHNKSFGKGQKKIINMIANIKPDLIAITGDIIDKRRSGNSAAITFASQAKHIAPVYYVPGNHEKEAGVFEQLSARLRQSGIFVAGNKTVQIKKDGAAITLIGTKDLKFYKTEEGFERRLKSLMRKAPNGFRLLLSHHPEKIELYAKIGYDLVLSGHAHGGQFRLPIIGAIFAPNQGVFPKYTSGLYKKGVTSMVVSRGLGNSLFPLRLFNRPELVVITLKRR